MSIRCTEDRTSTSRYFTVSSAAISAVSASSAQLQFDETLGQVQWPEAQAFALCQCTAPPS